MTSRLHNTKAIENFFSTTARVNGFTYDMAKQFASKILSDEAKIEAVLTFNPAGFREDRPTTQMSHSLVVYVFVSPRR